jgi:hypothetical protein
MDLDIMKAYHVSRAMWLSRVQKLVLPRILVIVALERETKYPDLA